MSEPKLQLHATAPSWLGGRVSIILVSPTHPGNVGACARAMRVMGLRELILVAPADPAILSHPEAVARSSGATSILEQARVVTGLTEALGPVTLSIAISAEQREFGPPTLAPDEAAALVGRELLTAPGHAAALVFGTERTGLSISDVALCQRLCSIPGERDYHSLNLAQAVQILCYELRREALRQPAEGAGAASAEGGGALAMDELLTGSANESMRGPSGIEAGAGRAIQADAAQIEGLFAHLERALVGIGFLDPAHPKKLMPRLRRLFARSRLESEEVQLLRGILKLVEAPRRPPPGR